MHRHLNVPLTPLQHAFDRLETGGIVLCSVEGKRRVYRFNPEYPFLNELEMLLKRAFASLPPSEKKLYFYLNHLQDGSLPERERLIYRAWEKLKKVRRIRFSARSRPAWEGVGEGAVRVEESGAGLLFHEAGKWIGRDLQFRNVFRWTFSPKEGLVGLEHLRFGPQRPVFLFHLQPTRSNLLESLHSHLCGEDTYFGQLYLAKNNLRLHWRILGPRKNEHVDFHYFF